MPFDEFPANENNRSAPANGQYYSIGPKRKILLGNNVFVYSTPNDNKSKIK